MDTRLEQHLSEIESAAAPVYEALLNGEIPQGEQKRVAFAQFVAIAYARTPTMRRMYAELRSKGSQMLSYAHAVNERAFDALIGSYCRDTGEVFDEETKAKVRAGMMDPSDYIVEISRESTLRALTISDTLTPIFLQMKWAIIRPQHGFFITTDSPVVRDTDPTTHHPIFGDGGFFNKTVEVKYPLSPQRLLMMTWRNDRDGFSSAARPQVEKCNRGLAARADNYLYAHIQDIRLERLAKEFRSSRQSMTIQGIGPKKYAETRVARRNSKSLADA